MDFAEHCLFMWFKPPLGITLKCGQLNFRKSEYSPDYPLLKSSFSLCSCHFSNYLTICCYSHQGSTPESMMRTAMKNGHWVVFQNCHLVPDWLPTLERLIACISLKKVRTYKNTTLRKNNWAHLFENNFGLYRNRGLFTLLLAHPLCTGPQGFPSVANHYSL